MTRILIIGKPFAVLAGVLEEQLGGKLGRQILPFITALLGSGPD